MKIFSYISLGLLITIAIVIPYDIFAVTADYAKDLDSHSMVVKSVVFGPALKITAYLGAALGIGLSFFRQSPMPLIIFGIIALICVVVPTFIEKVVGVSTMLLP